MNLAAFLGQLSLEAFAQTLPEASRIALIRSLSETVRRLSAHGDAPRFTQALECLSDLARSPEDCVAALHQLGPWKKGPHLVRGIAIDAEWDSLQKWGRLLALKLDFQDKSMLDIGAGNGFYLRQMVQAGASFALGVEPSVLCLYQFLATSLLQPEPGMAMLGLRGEALPNGFPQFDIVLSMGVLYHVRSPVDHLVALRKRLAPGGQLVLETIAFEGSERDVLVPRDRYANMRNVWFIPSTELLDLWLARAGFDVETRSELVPTTPTEQRSTPFAPGPSLAGALDGACPSQTVEGYPAPARLIVTARARHISDM
jgi:tRNA (mo5U34)-methyltransferase